MPFIPMPLGTDDWGRHTIGSPFMVIQEREIWVYFDVGRGHTNRTYKTPRPKQISLAKLRRDGFAGYTSGPEGGYIETAPFVAGGQLRLNLNAVDGEARVEVLEVTGDIKRVRKRVARSISEFTADQCQPLTGDLFDAEVQWKEASWQQLHGRLVSLRIHLTNATLYSFWTRSR